MTDSLTISTRAGSEPELDIDDAMEVYGGRERIEDGDGEFDDQGNSFEARPAADNGHLFKTECGATRCVNCGCKA